MSDCFEENIKELTKLDTMIKRLSFYINNYNITRSVCKKQTSETIEDKLEIRKDAIAICSGGLVGVISVDEPIEVNYNDGNKGIAWSGYQLSNSSIKGRGDEGKVFDVEIGGDWSSRNPTVIGHAPGLSDFIKKFKS